MKVVPQDLPLDGMWGMRKKEQSSMISLRWRWRRFQGKTSLILKNLRILLGLSVEMLQRLLDFSGKIRLKMYLEIVCIMMICKAVCLKKYRGKHREKLPKALSLDKPRAETGSREKRGNQEHIES